MSAPLTVHQFPAFINMQPSPFGLKLETWLRMNKLPYDVEFSPMKMGPKGKVPFVSFDNQVMGDSELIIEALQAKHGLKEEGLNPEDKAKGLLVRRMVEEHLYFILVYSRWADPVGWEPFKKLVFSGVPFFIRGFISNKAHKAMGALLKSQGIARHTRDEIYQMAEDDLNTLSTILGEGTYFLGDSPTLTDASAYGLLANILYDPTQTRLLEILKKSPNLIQYSERMKSGFWSDASRGGGEKTKFTP
ncbi:glutathione S-transferase family protein [Sneathiella sp. P13V-1]|uniref:glutathione S-transferase family protein n=1 Tax=Sneathiella sp. P13V-1 TaxID=2697366 RepID=UPI00187B302C|nr:glutathione S-transferase family protein [Sneathiella sp. P13V-1]MBE7636109.1 glutathione S-transferase family protein [Sneathiella sp. P13V-1]